MPHVHECTGQDCCYCHCYHHFHQAPRLGHPSLVRRHSSLRRQLQREPLASPDDDTSAHDAVSQDAGQKSRASAEFASGPSVRAKPNLEATIGRSQHDKAEMLDSTDDETNVVSFSTPSVYADDLPATKPRDGASGSAKTVHDNRTMGQGNSDFVRAGGWGRGPGIVAAHGLLSFQDDLPDHKEYGAEKGWMDTSGPC